MIALTVCCFIVDVVWPINHAIQQSVSMTAAFFEAHHCPLLLSEIKKTKLDSSTELHAGINSSLLPFVPLL
jgi:hypothetical protein